MPLPDGAVEALIDLACLAPSVGLNQPWRFVIVDDDNIRCAIRQNFANCNADAPAAQSAERAALYARLKLAGFELAILPQPSTRIPSRRTMLPNFGWA